MKLVTFSPPDQGPRVGALVEGHVIDLLAASGDNPAFGHNVEPGGRWAIHVGLGGRPLRRPVCSSEHVAEAT